jgi:hypothetical protein
MRGRPKLAVPSRSLNTHLDEALMARLDLELFSPLESRVPKGAYQKFLNDRLREYFATRTLDLAPFLGTLPGEVQVRGSEFAIERLASLLKETK